MYQSPDFIKVSVKVKDVYSSYLATGCIEDEGMMWVLVSPCEGTSGAFEIGPTTFTAEFSASQCYSTNMP